MFNVYKLAYCILNESLNYCLLSIEKLIISLEVKLFIILTENFFEIKKISLLQKNFMNL